ncbi:MAG: hypothetical protein RMJ84_12520, partial [Sandaracinaceae bacterium]|nr:hypothetical protein [Sandaracinaceae bacterium]
MRRLAIFQPMLRGRGVLWVFCVFGALALFQGCGGGDGGGGGNAQDGGRTDAWHGGMDAPADASPTPDAPQPDAFCERCGGGTCVDLMRDPQNCGACGRRCVGMQQCIDGICQLVCPSDRGDCDGDMSNGCETNLMSSTEHCGRCGRACGGGNALWNCQGGECVISMCARDYWDCNGLTRDGCEANLQTDPNHCGTCGNVCPSRNNATPTCSFGMCGFSCMSGFADCDRDPNNGCERN